MLNVWNSGYQENRKWNSWSFWRPFKEEETPDPEAQGLEGQSAKLKAASFRRPKSTNIRRCICTDSTSNRCNILEEMVDKFLGGKQRGTVEEKVWRRRLERCSKSKAGGPKKFGYESAGCSGRHWRRRANQDIYDKLDEEILGAIEFKMNCAAADRLGESGVVSKGRWD